MQIFDYLFYRIYSFYKSKRDSTPIWMATLVLSVMLCFTLLAIATLLSIVLSFQFNNNSKLLMAIPLISFPLIIWKKYSKFDIIQDLISHYKDEKLSRKRVRGWLFILYLILVMLIPISIGYMRHNLGMDI